MTALDAVRASYDAVADEYARRFADEMDRKPFDRKLLDWLVEKVSGRGVICDLGCGPGQIARYLHRRGVPACGLDLSPAMVAEARRLNPDVPFAVGDMLDLSGVADEAFGGIAAFYSIIHIPRDRLPQALRELRRVLRPGGVLLLAFHLGEETVHLDEWWGRAVDVDFHFLTRPAVKQRLSEAGFLLEEALERDPYPEDVEYQSRRAYLFARRPAGAFGLLG